MIDWGDGACKLIDTRINTNLEPLAIQFLLCSKVCGADACHSGGGLVFMVSLAAAVPVLFSTLQPWQRWSDIRPTLNIRKHLACRL
jgi:hypothetical protein